MDAILLLLEFVKVAKRWCLSNKAMTMNEDRVWRKDLNCGEDDAGPLRSVDLDRGALTQENSRFAGNQAERDS